jgi:DNA-binding MarR family transcriptional regulator
MAAATDRLRARDLWHELVRAQAVALPLVHKALRRRYGLSLTELVLLQALASAPRGRATMSALQQATHLSPAGTTRVAAGLEGRGLLRRSRSGDDRRLLHVELTSTGQELCSNAQTAVDNLVLTMLDGTPLDHDVAVAARVLAVVTSAAAVTQGERTTAATTARGRRNSPTLQR